MLNHYCLFREPVSYLVFKIFQNLGKQKFKRIILQFLILALFFIPNIYANDSAAAITSKFASYEETPVNITPQVPAYTVDKDFANITNKDDFTFSEAAQDSLLKNGFVVIPSHYEEFFTLYEFNRYSLHPNFITTDSILHNYHLVFDYLLRSLEKEKLILELKSLNAVMLSSSLKQYNSLKGTEWENAAKRNVGFFAVGSKLLEVSIKIPPLVENEVKLELALIEAHEKIEFSPVMNMKAGEDTKPQLLEALIEDYTQYIPRGHYDKTEPLKAYFKAMMWYGRLTFRFKNEDEIKSALLITLALKEESIQRSWEKISEPINFLVGKSDDLTYYQLEDLLEQVYGQNTTPEIIPQDKNKFSHFVELAKKLSPPQINSIPIFQASISPDREKEIKGFRFMGQRFTIDAYIFQRLVTREVGPKGEPCSNAPFIEGRMLPKGLDIPAAMGSPEALNILKEQGELEYACYLENMNKTKEYISGLKITTQTQNLYWGWLYSLQPLTTEKGEGYPAFMRNSAWLRKELNTYLGSWAELKHDTILYAKQVYAELGGGGMEEKDDRGYVEPNPYVYGRLASLIKMTQKGLESRGLLKEKNKENLVRMATLALALKTISEKELNNVNLSEEEHDLIRSYGGQLEHFWLEALCDEGVTSPSQLDQNPAAMVADVATDPNGQVLEVGTGYILEIYVVVPLEGKLRIAKGGVFSYYEFAWPMSDRLTDSKWRELLNTDKNPPLPDWVHSFMPK